MRTLIVFYSAEGHTKKIAEMIGKNLGADLYEIDLENPYSKEDLDWTNPDSRASQENDEPKLRENIRLKNPVPPNWENYDRVILGYPIWWGIAAWPTNAFVKSNDWSHKTVLPFCTSHTSGLGDSDLLLKAEAGSGNWQNGIRFFQDANAIKVKAWTDTLN